MFDYLFKIILVGDSGVGKSCTILRLTSNSFVNSHDITIGVEYGTKYINTDNKKIKLQIWDTAGQECFKSIIRAYYRDSAGVLVCYDITDRKSFQHVENWINEILKECIKKPKMILVGTKHDIENNRQVSMKEAQELADEHDMAFIETSSKTGEGIEKCFNIIAQKIYDDVKLNNDGNQENQFNIPGVRITIAHQIDTMYEKTEKQCCKIL